MPGVVLLSFLMGKEGRLDREAKAPTGRTGEPQQEGGENRGQASLPRSSETCLTPDQHTVLGWGLTRTGTP